MIDITASERSIIQDFVHGYSFRKIRYISKLKVNKGYKMVYITDNGDFLSIGPTFENENDHYKGLELSKNYTLEQLGVKSR